MLPPIPGYWRAASMLLHDKLLEPTANRVEILKIFDNMDIPKDNEPTLANEADQQIGALHAQARRLRDQMTTKEIYSRADIFAMRLGATELFHALEAHFATIAKQRP